jgi:hypothetical protein
MKESHTKAGMKRPPEWMLRIYESYGRADMNAIKMIKSGLNMRRKDRLVRLRSVRTSLSGSVKIIANNIYNVANIEQHGRD